MAGNKRYENKPDNEVAEPLYGGKTAGISYSFLVIVYFVISFFVSFIITATGLDTGSDGYLYLSYLVSPVALLVTLAYFLWVKKSPIKGVVKFKCGLAYYVFAILMIFGLMFSLGWVNDLFVKLFSFLGYEPSKTYLPDLSGGRVVLALLVIAVIPAIVEELFFRALLFRTLENGTGSVRAIFLCGFCFALYHGSPEQTVYQFICGCCFALLVMRSRAVTPAVIIHFLNNALIIVLYALGLVDSSGNLVLSQTANIILTVCGAVCLIFSVVMLILDKRDIKKGEKGNVVKFFLYGLVGIVIMLAVWVYSLVAYI